MSEETKVWYASAINNYKVFSLDFLYPTDEARPEPQQRLDIKRHYQAGGLLADGALPTKLYCTVRDLSERQKSRLPHVFQVVDGYFLISEKLRDVLAGFDLGATRMIPVEIHEYDKVTQRPERVFLLNVAERKDCFVPDASEGPQQYRKERLWSPTFINPVIALRPEAVSGVDLWFDETLRMTFFFSDPLVRAMKKARITWPGIEPAVLVG